MATSKILTISIAAYNMQDFLSRCLDSLLNVEIIDDIEILIINDGSRDETLKIAQSYQERYPASIKVVNKENGGWGSTVNLGIQIATGRYFKLLDADDWFNTKEFVTFIYKLKNINVDLIVTPYSKEFVSKSKTKKYGFTNVEYSKIYNFQKWDGYYNCGTFWFDLPSITYRTELLQKNSIQISECFYSDIEYDCYPLKYIHSIVFFDYCVYKYFIGRDGQSISAEGATKHYQDHFYICQKMIDFYVNSLNSSSLIVCSILKQVALAKIRLNYEALMRLYINRLEAKKLLKEFDFYLKCKNIELYNLLEYQWHIKKIIYPLFLWRKFRWNVYQSYIFNFLYKLIK